MSFHTDFDAWQRLTEPQNCPVCANVPMPDDMQDVFEFPHSWLNAEPVEPLRGACHLTAKQHVVELYELSESELLGLMKELQICIRALKTVTRAVKINVEQHGNSLPHLHFHLYPRYMNDPFPNRAIDYTQKRNQYAEGEFSIFVQNLRAEISGLLLPETPSGDPISASVSSKVG